MSDRQTRVTEYRALALGITVGGHPVQAISQSLQDMDAWAHKIAEVYQCTVRLFVLREYTLKNVKPKYKKKLELPEDSPKDTSHCLVCGDSNCIRDSHREYKGRKPA